MTTERQAQILVESSQVEISYNTRKNAEPDNQYVIRVSEQLRAQNTAQLEETQKVATEKRGEMLDEEVKALIG